MTAHSKAVAHAYIDDCTECYIVFELFFYKSAAIIVSYVEIQHKTAFEAKSLDFLAFYLISLILTEMFSYIIEFVIVYIYMYKSQTREEGWKILNQLLNPLCMFI